MMMKLSGIVLLVVAAALLFWGLDSSGTFHSEVSRFFQGVPTNRTVWLYAGSAAAGVLGLGLLFSRKPRKAE